MMEKLKAIIIAPKGKLGKLIARQAVENEKIELVGAVGKKGADYIGQDMGTVIGLGREVGALVYDDIEQIIEQADMVIDFSTVEASMAALHSCLQHKKAFVCGTTGFTKEQVAQIRAASNHIPLLYAANTSRAVNLMNHLLEIAAKTLGAESQIDIIEMHDKLKLDAPSGTSLEMGHAIAEVMGLDFEQSAEYGRRGRGVRAEDKITYHSLRSGDISSSHTVIFGMLGERLEITHHAHNWECFAKGALDSALYLQGKPIGLYSVQDTI